MLNGRTTELKTFIKTSYISFAVNYQKCQGYIIYVINNNYYLIVNNLLIILFKSVSHFIQIRFNNSILENYI